MAKDRSSRATLRMVSRAWALMTRSERVKFSLSVLARALTNLLDLVGLALVGLIVVIATNSASLAGVAVPNLGTSGIGILALLALVVFVGRSALAIFFGRISSRVAARIELRLSSETLENLIYGRLTEIKNRPRASLQYALNSSGAALGGLLNTFSTVITELVLLFLIALAFLWINWGVAVGALVYFALVAFILARVSGRVMQKSGRQLAEGAVEVGGLVGDCLESFRELSVMRRQRLFLNRFISKRGRLAQAGAKNFLVSGLPRHVIETALIVGMVLFIGVQMATNNLTSGLVTLGVFLAGGMRIMASLLPLQNCLSMVSQHAQGCQALLDMAETLPRPDRKSSQGPCSSPDTGLAVTVKNLCFSYPDRRVLSEVNLEARPGQTLAIIGPSGSGKTTLVDLILGLIRPDSGKILLGGHDPDWACQSRLVGYVPQRPSLLAGTLLENVAVGLERDQIDPDQAKKVLKLAGLEELLDSLPRGLNTPLEGQGSEGLSGGQIQRMGLARALYKKPALLIMDEATSALDAASEARINQTLSTLHGRITTIIIAHRLSTVRHADWVYVLEAGKVLAEGPFDDLVRNHPLVAEYARLMSLDTAPNEQVGR